MGKWDAVGTLGWISRCPPRKCTLMIHLRLERGSLHGGSVRLLSLVLLLYSRHDESRCKRGINRNLPLFWQRSNATRPKSQSEMVPRHHKCHVGRVAYHTGLRSPVDAFKQQQTFDLMWRISILPIYTQTIIHSLSTHHRSSFIRKTQCHGEVPGFRVARLKRRPTPIKMTLLPAARVIVAPGPMRHP